MPYLVIGASGLLGSGLMAALGRRGEVVGTAHRHEAPGLVTLDARDPAAVRALVAAHRPEVVLMPAADPNVDRCQLEPQATREINVDAVAIVAAEARRGGARLVHFSSDYVFDGTEPPYREEHPTAPLNEYGRQKLEAEGIVLGVSPANLVLRVAWLYGWELQGKNFVVRALARLRAGDAVTAPDFQRGTPTWVPDLADAIADLLERDEVRGVLHLAGPESVDRSEHARLVAAAFDLDAGLVEAMGPDRLRQPAPRPSDPSLNSSRAESLLGRRLLGPREGLQRMREMES